MQKFQKFITPIVYKCNGKCHAWFHRSFWSLESIFDDINCTTLFLFFKTTNFGTNKSRFVTQNGFKILTIQVICRKYSVRPCQYQFWVSSSHKYKMAPIVIYGMPPSPPTRILAMTCDVLGLEFEMKPCNIMAGDNRKPEYLKVSIIHIMCF